MLDATLLGKQGDAVRSDLLDDEILEVIFTAYSRRSRTDHSIFAIGTTVDGKNDFIHCSTDLEIFAVRRLNV